MKNCKRKSKALNFQGTYVILIYIFQTRWFKSGPVVQTVFFYGHGQSVTLAFQKKNKAIQCRRNSMGSEAPLFYHCFHLVSHW